MGITPKNGGSQRPTEPLYVVPHDTSGAEVTVQGILHRTIVGPAINNQRTVTQRASAEAGRGSAPRWRAFVLPAPQPCTTTYDACGGASMLSVIREGLEEAIEEKDMDWEMKNSPAVTNTELGWRWKSVTEC